MKNWYRPAIYLFLPSIAGIISEIDQQPAEKTAEEKNTTGVIKGNTTFKELLDWGIKKEDIEKAINDNISNTNQVIKEYAGAKAIEFGTNY